MHLFVCIGSDTDNLNEQYTHNLLKQKKIGTFGFMSKSKKFGGVEINSLKVFK